MKAFTTFKMEATNYLVTPRGNEFAIADETGTNYGVWLDVETFKKYVKQHGLNALQLGRIYIKYSDFN